MSKYKNLCTGCNQDFTSVELFDAHRVGKHEYTYWEGMRFNPPVEDGRRCLSIEEMEAKGWKIDNGCRWFDPARVERARAAFAR